MITASFNRSWAVRIYRKYALKRFYQIISEPVIYKIYKEASLVGINCFIQPLNPRLCSFDIIFGWCYRKYSIKSINAGKAHDGPTVWLEYSFQFQYHFLGGGISQLEEADMLFRHLINI